MSYMPGRADNTILNVASTPVKMRLIYAEKIGDRAFKYNFKSPPGGFMKMISRISSHLFFLLGLLLAGASFAQPIDDTIRQLRNERAVAEDLAVTIKTKFKPSTVEYKEAKRLYEQARREYSRFTEEFVFAISHSELKDFKPSAARASEAGKAFQSYVVSKTQTLGGPLAGVLELGESVVKVAEGISKELREWLDRYSKQRKELAEDIERLLVWKDWDKLS
jgi:hypothetical protein